MLKILLVLCTCFATCQLIAQPIEKMLPFRAGDSLWIYQRAFAADRFFIGEKMVRRREWLMHLEQGDKEANEMVVLARQLRTKGNIIGVAGFVSLMAGLLTLSFNTGSNSNQNNALPIILLSGGIAADIVSTVYYTKSANRYRQAWRIFNYKANKGTLQPVALGIGAGANGIGLQVG